MKPYFSLFISLICALLVGCNESDGVNDLAIKAAEKVFTRFAENDKNDSEILHIDCLKDVDTAVVFCQGFGKNYVSLKFLAPTHFTSFRLSGHMNRNGKIERAFLVGIPDDMEQAKANELVRLFEKDPIQ